MNRFSRRTVLGGAGGAALAATVGVTATASATSTASAPQIAKPRPRGKGIVLLVHGAFADGSSWSAVTGILQRSGHQVVATANPLRGLAYDSAHVRAVLATLPGPVTVVGHSYGGAVITNAAAGATNVSALVYVAAVAPDEGESLGALAENFPPSDLNQSLIQVPYTEPGGTAGVDLYVERGAFVRFFAPDVPHATAAVLAAAQRPLSPAALAEPSGPPAWKEFPSWYAVSKLDKAIPPDGQRFMAQRIGATVTELNASHASMVSQPAAVARIIRAAAKGSR